MAKFKDPVTGTNYDPFGDPAGTALKFVYAVGGIAMTALAVSIATGNVLPRLQSFLGGLLGVDAGGDSVSIEF